MVLAGGRAWLGDLPLRGVVRAPGSGSRLGSCVTRHPFLALRCVLSKLLRRWLAQSALSEKREGEHLMKLMG